MDMLTLNQSADQTLFFSIVIPVYNRDWCVERAVMSAVDFLRNCGKRGEIVLIDDGSSDQSVQVVERLIAERRDLSMTMRLLRHAVNRGVCAAKNSGAFAAAGAWIIFLDSDDELIGAAAPAVVTALKLGQSNPLHFFACVDETGAVSKVPTALSRGTLVTLLTTGTGGEALPVVRAEVFRSCPYDEDIRGYESLSYLRILRATPFFILHSLVARRYYVLHADRLSSRAGMKRRTRDLRLGHMRVLREHWSVMSPAALVKQALRVLKATVWGY